MNGDSTSAGARRPALQMNARSPVAPLRVLLVEDSPADAVLVEEGLAAQAPGQFAVECVNTLAAARGRLVRGDLDCVLLDLSLPDAHGLDGVAGLLEVERGPALVVLTGNPDDSLALRALKLGAQDWLAKDAASTDAIARTVRYAVERRRAGEALTRAEERFRSAFAAGPIGMAILGLDGRFLDVNDTLCEITRYGAGELLATSLQAITHPDDDVIGSADMELVVSGRARRTTSELRLLTATAEEIWVTASRALVPGDEGLDRVVLQVQDLTDRKRFEERLRFEADHDPLTGLFNRRRLEEELERHARQVARYGPKEPLLVLDLDHFKHVNDTLGHAAGDELIVGVAALLRERLRGSDLIARLGGDEFAVLLPKADAEGASKVAEDLRAAVRERVAVRGRKETHGVTVSIGVALFEQGGEASGDHQLITADIAMYEAKEAGRDRRRGPRAWEQGVDRDHRDPELGRQDPRRPRG